MNKFYIRQQEVENHKSVCIWNKHMFEKQTCAVVNIETMVKTDMQFRKKQRRHGMTSWKNKAYILW